MERFVYFYFNRDVPNKIGPVVSAHVQYWHSANLPEYVGGPFGDRTGGLISFAASSLQEAAAIVEQDPFVREDLIEQHWLKEWKACGQPGSASVAPHRSGIRHNAVRDSSGHFLGVFVVIALVQVARNGFARTGTRQAGRGIINQGLMSTLCSLTKPCVTNRSIVTN